MYPRNAASPERVSIGAVVQISDGAVQTTGVAVKVIPFGGSEASATGSVAYSADGVVLYTPVQAETNYTSFVLIASKAGCIPASVTVVTTASDVAGTAVLDSTIQAQIDAIETFATRITTGIVQDGAFWQFTANMLELGPAGGGGGGDATLANQEAILAALTGTEVIQVASPNVLGNLVLTQGDSYDGIANPKATWTVTTDYTDGWAVTLTIRDADDVVIYTTAGTVASSTSIQVEIEAPTGLTMTGSPGQWQGKFDVELVKAGSKKTIALGVCYINEDQTR